MSKSVDVTTCCGVNDLPGRSQAAGPGSLQMFALVEVFRRRAAHPMRDVDGPDARTFVVSTPELATDY